MKWNRSPTRTFKFLISLGLVYHLMAVGLAPNAGSVIGRRLNRVFSDYTSSLGLATTWQFFSPNPFTSFVEYEITSADQEDDEPESFEWPPKLELVSTREGYNRRLSHSMFMSGNERHVTEFFVPFLCRRHKEATELSYRIATLKLGSVDDAGTRTFDDFTDLREKEYSAYRTFSCEGQR